MTDGCFQPHREFPSFGTRDAAIFFEAWIAAQCFVWPSQSLPEDPKPVIRRQASSRIGNGNFVNIPAAYLGRRSSSDSGFLFRGQFLPAPVTLARSFTSLIGFDRAAMDTHAQLNAWIALQGLADFHRTFHRRFGVVENISAIPSPVTSRISLPSASAF